MNVELAQLIALAAHGSAWLAGRTGELPELEHGNSTFQYVRSVRFELPGRLLRAPTTSSSVTEWLLAVRERHIGRLSLVAPSGRPPDRNAMAFAGTYPAFVVASSPKGRSSGGPRPGSSATTNRQTAGSGT